MKYEIYEGIHGFEIYERTFSSYVLVKVFKTRKGAENWVKKRS